MEHVRVVFTSERMRGPYQNSDYGIMVRVINIFRQPFNDVEHVGDEVVLN